MSAAVTYPATAVLLRVGMAGLLPIGLRDVRPGDDIVAVVREKPADATNSVGVVKTKRFPQVFLSALHTYLGAAVMEELNADCRVP